MTRLNKKINLKIKLKPVVPCSMFHVPCFKKLFSCAAFTFFLLLFPFVGKGSILYLIPQSEDVYQGDTLIVDVQIDTEGEEINAIDGQIKFDNTGLKVKSLQEEGTIIGLWVKKPSFSNKTGQIDFLGGVPNGFKGQGSLFKIIFQSASDKPVPFSMDVLFNANTKVLLNDGKGTLSAVKFSNTYYNIIEKPKNLLAVSSPSHPDRTRWYRDNTFYVHWDIKEGVQYSYLLSKSPLAEPDDIPDKPEGRLIWMGNMKYEGLEDGIYYFHVKQKMPGEQWSPKTTYTAMIDSTIPEEYQLQITEIEGRKYLVFSASDKTSGIDHYEIQEVNNRGILGRKIEEAGEWKIANSPYLLENPNSGAMIKIKAVDKAGNERISELVLPQKLIPYGRVILSILVFVGIILVSVWALFRKFRNKKT